MLKRFTIKIILTFIVFFTFSFSGFAQTASTGSLSINPTSISISNTGVTTTLSVIYTGVDITAAEVYLTLGSGIKINSFTVGTGLSKLYDSTTTNEIHVGSLDAPITSGQTLFTFVVEATSCGQSGQIGFNTTNTSVPNVSLTFNGSNYTVSCNGATPTPTVSGGTIIPVTTSFTPTSLPKTASSNEYTYIFLSSVSLFGLGFLVWTVLAKARLSKKEEDISIVTIE